MRLFVGRILMNRLRPWPLKGASDSFAGSLTFIRVYSGTVKVEINSTTLAPKKRACSKMYANSRTEISCLRAGDLDCYWSEITGTGDTLCDSKLLCWNALFS